jgi:hypothetical protein
MAAGPWPPASITRRSTTWPRPHMRSWSISVNASGTVPSPVEWITSVGASLVFSVPALFSSAKVRHGSVCAASGWIRSAGEYGATAAKVSCAHPLSTASSSSAPSGVRKSAASASGYAASNPATIM